MLVGLTLLAASHVIALYVVGLFLVVVANTVSGTAGQGLVPDCVPARQRGTASGYMGLMTILGTVGSLAVASVLLSQNSIGHGMAAGTFDGAALFYTLAAAVLIVSIGITIVGVREAPHLHFPHLHHHASGVRLARRRTRHRVRIARRSCHYASGSCRCGLRRGVMPTSPGSSSRAAS